MRVIAITMEKCPKCQEAKELLTGMPIEWMSIDYNPGARKIIETHDLVYAPSFIIIDDEGNEMVEISMFKVRDLLEKNTGK